MTLTGAKDAQFYASRASVSLILVLITSGSKWVDLESHVLLEGDMSPWLQASSPARGLD